MGEHDAKKQSLKHKKSINKLAMQHESASIYLQQKYLNRPRKMRSVLRSIVAATQKWKEKVPKSLNIEFVYNLLSRMHQAHLLLSRAHKYASYHNLSVGDTPYNVMKSLECVAFALYTMFGERKEYKPYSVIRWKMYDLKFYIDFYISQVAKQRKGNVKTSKKSQQNEFHLGHKTHVYYGNGVAID